ncbi:sensor domain-containing phosphodiesterase [Zooshikella harenae]|uniref:Sensor domain-containing phosphodiesterase n=1 Tax=Zooshikella harenae TaxID=2827238 RepID=A0ABS5ZBQ3_9GAMM|nr:GGDEF domain-containing protein [Zooshikella harenae]MBU2711488.1 sensor domain-containing phosphodiesterase [Zooshikella harenae]
MVQTEAIATFKKPPLSLNEDERINDLKLLNILDTSSEERFDRITELMADVLDVPIALVSLVDSHRQWFKSTCGLQASETSRDISFCGHAILESEILVIEDAYKDNRFANNPLVVGEPYIRFYAGVVLRGPMGHPVGTCCIIDRKPRVLTGRQRNHLLIFSDLVESELLHNYNVFQLKEQTISNAFYDPVTGLSNQRLLIDRFQQTIINNDSFSNIVICIINICRFSHLINAWGRKIGDQVLQDVAVRLKSELKKEYTVAYLEGDKFAVLGFTRRAKEANNTTNIKYVLPSKLCSIFQKSFCVNGIDLYLKVRVGVSEYPGDGKDALTLLENARMCSKSSNKDSALCVVYFSDESSQLISRQFILEQHLQKGIENNNFYLVYQPIVCINSGEIIGFETLLRFCDSVLGDVSPSEFIPVAEQTGLISLIGEWVLKTVCKHICQWKKVSSTFCKPITVNLSGVQLVDKGLVTVLLGILEEYDVGCDAVQFEVTESCILKDFDAALMNMNLLSNLGFKFLIDDFGTGYSSLSYLQRMPIYKVKLDRSFIINIDKENADCMLVHNIINLSHDIGLAVVAEGVENNEQLSILKDLGCDQVQCFLISKPLPYHIVSKRVKDSDFCYKTQCL